MRVCIVTPFHWAAGMGGAEYQAKLLTEHLVQAGVQVIFLAAHVRRDFVPDGYDIVPIGHANPLRRYGTFVDAWALYRKLRSLRPDLIFQQVGCAYTGVAGLYGKRHGCPVLWRVSSDANLSNVPPPWWRRPHHYLDFRLLNFGIRSVTCIAAQTEQQRRVLARRFARDDVHVIRNFHPLPKEELHKGAPFRVLWVANLKRLKQPEVFIGLAERFRDEPNVEFVMVGGEGDDPKWVAATKARLAQVPNLDCRGLLSQDEVNQALASAHFLVNTSRYEGFPNVFVQAWMRDAIVLSLNVDPDGLLSERGLGRVCGSEEQLAADLRLLMENEEARKRVMNTARNYALSYHGEQNLTQLAGLMNTLVEQGGPKEIK